MSVARAAAAPERTRRRSLDRLSQSEVVVLQAATALELAARARRLADWLEARPSVELDGLAQALSQRVVVGMPLLAIVAAGRDDLLKKLGSAAGRLERPDCRQIRDSAGIYYFADPLGLAGKLAIVFPGEGAQYVDMLGDVAPRFSIIRDYLDSCDERSVRLSSRGEPIGQLLCMPDHWDEPMRHKASEEFADLGVAMFAVLVADRCFHLLLSDLGVEPDATAGHSMGEFCALMAGGAVDDATMPLAQVVGTIESLESDAGGAAPVETMLLAVGAGRAAMESLAAELDLADVYVGMDNCPHQAVVVGAKASMAKVEAELKARGALFERVPFRRPYHTPLFAPYLGRLDAMFDGAVFRPTALPVYSCTTAAPFPDNPAAIRSLAVAHWAAPVEFTRAIERMYADGIRLFVEAGPRGNLSAFIEDILRGKSFAALPANVQRRPGMVQFNHLIAQLAAHGRPIRWNRLYAEREVPTVDLDGLDTEFDDAPAAGYVPRGAGLDAAATIAIGSAAGCSDETAAIVSGYLRVMDEFLDLQQETMARYFGAGQWLQPRPGEAAEAHRGTLPFGAMAAALDEAGLGMPATGDPIASARRQIAIGETRHRPLLGEIVAFVPGASLTARRTLTLDEIRFAGDHTVGGRKVSRVEPEQHGLPVMPMTGSLEMMAEHAELLAPGLVATAVENVRLGRWLAVDDPPHVVEITARVRLADANQTAIDVEIHDLGSDPARPNPKLAARGTVVFAATRAEPPTVGPFELKNERPCRISIEVLYRNLFHGPMFLGVQAMPRVGDDGIEATIEVLKRDQLIGSTSEPDFILDPVLLDVTMHPLAAWHLEQPDQAGRILLPIGLKRLEIFADPAPVGLTLSSRGRIVEQSARHFVKSFETVDGAGRLLYRFDSVQYWRFYVPFGEVNFHGPKDEYFLSKKVAWSPAADGKAVLMWFDPPLDIRQPVIRGAAAKVTLGADEFAAYRALPGPEPAIDAWLFGRIAAKDAARQLWYERHGKRHYPADLFVELDDAGGASIRWRAAGPDSTADYLTDLASPLPNVDIATLDGEAFALAAFAEHLGVAASKRAGSADKAADVELTDYERSIVATANGEGPMLRARIQVAKRAAARSHGIAAADAHCKDFDPATGAALVLVGEGDAIDVWTSMHGDFVVAAAIA